MVVERAGRERFTNEEKPRLHELVRAKSTLNRELFWADVAEQRTNGSYGPVLRHWQVYFSGSAPLWTIAEADFDWLINDLRVLPKIEDRQIALGAIINVLQQTGRLAAEATNLRGVIDSEPVLLAELQAALSPPPEDASGPLWCRLFLCRDFIRMFDFS